MLKLISAVLVLSGIVTQGWAATVNTQPGGIVNNGPPKPVLADANLLKYVGAQMISEDAATGIGYAMLPYAAEYKLSQTVHSMGRCGGFESLEGKNMTPAQVQQSFAQVRNFYGRSRSYRAIARSVGGFTPRPEVQTALADLKVENLKKWVTWMSAFPTRYNKQPDPNIHVRALYEQLTALLKSSGRPARVDLIDHKSTKQKSIRVHLDGATTPQEILVFGAHFDSIALYGGGNAPGADDDASGSSNLLEVLRVVLNQPRTARSLEFFFYAGEESGLLGSSEIADAYKAAKQNVISVLQLDMTLYPGAGANSFTFMSDFTSPWLIDVMTALNETYIQAKVLSDKCGYGCSDHASWFRNGYPTAMPFEATMRTMNEDIHSSKDVIGPKSNFDHSMNFSKLALSMALELGNSTQKQSF